ncbi:TPA: homoserine dehydrogenase [Streptococcus agalactiae]|jgi:homoserine dehydrogenase (EC 1.1.1.3)|uniref:Homoserine dehydrogenase n=1 Tax=Streptococcus agalactiae serotype V (strain ATCC BAA-611 / 2603 V/R) TaxID=208435 RepID=Q8DZI1_STRA5|nr:MULTISPECIES: homoserine dehydrogenase [Streptococcus]MEE3843913.1 homoserine dehydrogenase [Streptococcus sp. R4]AAN00002.1 homoserine dehydrogenase [Streptococcus agalactiae 2603V/R]AIX04887.1 homoserine dehydrogenase family protein [Streptococcus agalactiae CNCTC 10/84]AYY68597.1 homoserine dehydrogenase [Streptococcus sp. FDAARGOS_521]EPT54356.1 homoserine dehydrogenase [Streptococcus agalactiae CCUG 25532]
MTIKIALLGFGTVAKGIPYLLKENQHKLLSLEGEDIVIDKVLVRDNESRQRFINQGFTYNFVTEINTILQDSQIDIVVELMGGIEPAKTYLSQALGFGKHIVTANKDLIALHGKELMDLADARGLALFYEGAVAGGIPILRTLSHSFASDKMTRLLGILNGTSNFMLTKMFEEGWSYEQALKKAQELGYAESDPTNDVEGIDTAYKATILSQFGFGMPIDFDDVNYKGISSIRSEDVEVAQEMGFAIKLVADLRETPTGISVDVSPTLISQKHPLAAVNHVMNAVFIESIGIGQSLFYGPGAGQNPTATSVLADIIDISRSIRSQIKIKPMNTYHCPCRLSMQSDIFNEYYLAISLRNAEDSDTLGRYFEQENIGLKNVIEKALGDKQQEIYVLTDEVSQEKITQFIEEFPESGVIQLINVFKVIGG